MQTLYIDVFFLINFTVTLLSSFFAALFIHIKTNIRRLILVGTLGAVAALLDIFASEYLFLRILISALFLTFGLSFVSPGLTLKRRVRFLCVFILLQLLIGGIVEYTYSFLDRIFKGVAKEFFGEAENRKLLVFSLIILLTIGVCRLFICLFSSSQEEKSVRIGIKIGSVTVEEDALIDTGNLVKDPMNMSPVVFIKKEFAKTFLPKSVIELSDIDTLDKSFRKRIRLIPVTKDGSTHVITGIRVDEIGVVSGGRIEPVEMTVAIDKEGGTFGGFLALAPGLVCDYADRKDKNTYK